MLLVDVRKSKDGRGRYFLNLLGYLHGFKFGQDYALQMAPIILQPQIIVLPSVNQQQTVSVQKATTEENYQETGGITQEITGAKIIASTSPLKATVTEATIDKEIEDLKEESGNVEDLLRQSAKREVGMVANDIKLNEDLTTTNNDSISNVTNSVMPNKTTTLSPTKFTLLSAAGVYPAANYNNTHVENVTITTISPSLISSNLTSNVSYKVNVTSNTQTTDKNGTMIEETDLNELVSNSSGPYPAAFYNNNFVNELFLTTVIPSANVESLPSVEDDRWKQFSKTQSGFKPLAGLYYDGYLHVPILKKTGFTPYNNNYL